MLGTLYCMALQRQVGDLFAEGRSRDDRRDEILNRKPADRRYAIFFTPRSGSSRLTDMAEATRVLGRPDEFFNPHLLPGMAGTMNARDLTDYVDLLTRFRLFRGTFGTQLTYAHLVQVFRTEERFLFLLRPDSVVWLIRRDIVAQAVSISRMAQTRVSHTASASADDLARAEREFTYSAKSIRSYLWRLRWMERATEAFFACHGLSPLRISYETLCSDPPRDVLSRLARHVGADAVPEKRYDTAHRKIGGQKNAAFSDRFRKDHPRLMARVARERDSLLAALGEG